MTREMVRDAPAASRHAARRRVWMWTASGLVALAALGGGARALAAFEWDRVVDYRTPYAFDLEPGEPAPALSERAIVFIVDGLRADVARQLPTFSRLGDEGSFLAARTAEPSLSFPGWTALVSGAPPAISGVTTNWYEGRIVVDHLFVSARRAGLTTAVAGSEGWRQLLGDQVDASFFVQDERRDADPVIGRNAIRLLEEENPSLLVVHLPDVDHTGHAVGVGDAYRAAAERADRVIARVLEAAGRGTSAVLTSDHGHIDAGGHGGPEDVVRTTPLVLAGAGFVPGASGEVSQSDVAPTVAAVLGVARPSHATGTLRASVLEAGDETREAIRTAHQEVSGRFYARATAVVEGEGRTAEAFAEAREERARHDVLARLPLALLGVAALAVAVALATQRLDGPAMTLGVLVFVAAFVALFFGRGLTVSFSLLNTEDQVESFFLARVADTGIAALAAAFVVGLTTARRGWGRSFQTGLGTAGWIILVLSLGVAAFLVFYGWGFTWWLPNFTAAFAQYLGLLAIFLVGVGAAVMGALSLGIAWAASRGRR